MKRVSGTDITIYYTERGVNHCHKQNTIFNDKYIAELTPPQKKNNRLGLN